MSNYLKDDNPLDLIDKETYFWDLGSNIYNILAGNWTWLLALKHVFYHCTADWREIKIRVIQNCVISETFRSQ